MRRTVIGRTDELVRLSELALAGTPLISVIGAPGIGKTTLVEEWLRTRAPDGWRTAFVDLGAARDLPGAIALVREALGIDAGDGDTLGEEASRVPTLLALDSVEELATALGPRMERWLRAASELQIVAVSRVRLGSSLEHVVEVPTLDDDDALALLLARAGALDPALQARLAKDAHTRELASVLGGVPLALELAASRARFLAPRELAARCVSGEELLGASMDQAVARSTALLAPAHAALLARLSVFAGEVDASSAEQVCAVPGERFLDGLAALADASLLRWTPSRLSLLPPIREHARRLLESSGDAKTSEAHAAWAVARGRAWLEATEGPAWRDALTERDAIARELWIAARRARPDREPSLSAVLVVLHDALALRGATAETIPLLDEALAHQSASGADVAQMAIRRASAAAKRGELDLAERSLARAAAADPSSRASSRFVVTRALLSLMRADAETARGELDEAARRAKAAGDRRGESDLRAMLVDVLRQLGAATEAIDEGERSLALLGAGSPVRRAATLTALAFAASEAGDPTLARRYAEEGIAAHDAYHAGGSRTRAALALARGRAAQQLGEIERAVELYHQAREGADPRVSMYAAMALGSALVELGRPIEARDRWREMVDSVREGDATYGAILTALLAALEAKLGEPQRARSRIADLEGAISESPPHVGAIVAICARSVAGEPLELGELSARAAPEMRLVHRILELDAGGGAAPALRVAELRIASTGGWFEARGARVACANRPVMRRLLVALARLHIEHPGHAMDRDAITRCGWGDERMHERSARRRVEVMMSRIRAIGVGDALETTGDGYRLRPTCRVVLEADDGNQQES